MKAMVVSPIVGGRVPSTRGVLHNGLGMNGTRRDLEAQEVAAYLTKLRALVPDMPRKRKLSKLEVIQRVIEYICVLQTTLEETTSISQESTMSNSSSRQPLQPLLQRPLQLLRPPNYDHQTSPPTRKSSHIIRTENKVG